MLLNREQILNRLGKSVIISPFDARQCGNGSYDVRLGPWIYREQQPSPQDLVDTGVFREAVFNPFSQDDVQRVWGESEEHLDFILLRPGETILGHTLEFIGGRDTVNTMMKTRSSMGRSFIAACKCAGWGDVGYTSRWALEITNFSRYYTVRLPVGCRIAQIAFFQTEQTADYTRLGGKYQSITDQDELEASWKPSDMLPKLYADRDAPPQWKESM